MEVRARPSLWAAGHSCQLPSSGWLYIGRMVRQLVTPAVVFSWCSACLWWSFLPTMRATSECLGTPVEAVWLIRAPLAYSLRIRWTVHIGGLQRSPCFTWNVLFRKRTCWGVHISTIVGGAWNKLNVFYPLRRMAGFWAMVVELELYLRTE